MPLNPLSATVDTSSAEWLQAAADWQNLKQFYADVWKVYRRMTPNAQAWYEQQDPLFADIKRFAEKLTNFEESDDL